MPRSFGWKLSFYVSRRFVLVVLAIVVMPLVFGRSLCIAQEKMDYPATHQVEQSDNFHGTASRQTFNRRLWSATAGTKSYTWMLDLI